MNDQIEAFIIAVKEYREADAIITVLSKQFGIMKCIARGIRKIKSKNAYGCQLFTLSRIQMHHQEMRDLQMLQSVEIIESYRMIREDLLRQSIAAYFCEVISASNFETNMFSMLKTCMDTLKETKHPFSILCAFQVMMNRLHGIEPFVDGCVVCNRMDHICAVSTIRGGFVCEHCFHPGTERQMTAYELKSFRLLCKAGLEHYDALTHIEDIGYEQFAALYAYFEEYAGVRLHSIRFLQSLKDII